MLWTVVYKDRDGNQNRMEAEAENRAIVIGDMRRQGLQVVNIVEGGLKANSRRQKNRAAQLEETSRKSGILTWLLLLVLLATGSAAAWWYYNGKPHILEAISEKANPNPLPKHSGKALIRVVE